MRTPAQLREAGFTVAPSVDGVGCLSVTSDKPFWHYNARFYSAMSEVLENIAPATKGAGDRYELLLAGTWGDDEPLAYNILNEERYRLMLEARSRYIAANNDAQRAAADFDDALNVLEPYFT